MVVRRRAVHGDLARSRRRPRHQAERSEGFVRRVGDAQVGGALGLDRLALGVDGLGVPLDVPLRRSDAVDVAYQFEDVLGQWLAIALFGLEGGDAAYLDVEALADLGEVGCRRPGGGCR